MELTQKQTEAVIRLLLLARYQDRTLSLAEDDDVHKRIGALPWQSGESVELFIDRATAEVRAADEAPETKGRFLAAQAVVLSDEPVKHFVMKQLTGLMQSDGMAEVETDFLDEVRAVFSGA